MATTTEALSEPAPSPRLGRPRVSLGILRAVAALLAVGTALQPVFAGSYLAGNFDALDWHGLVNGHLVQVLSLLQLGAAVGYVTAGRGRGGPLLPSVVLFFAVNVQLGMGYARVLAIHLPLGVAIVVGQVLFTVWLFGAKARRGRAYRQRKATP